MTALSRQNTLFVSEDWIRIYEALENVDFRAYDFDNLIQALMQYLRVNYPDNFNDWIASSEFVTKIEILAWLSQNIAFRVDLNARENFLATAERRESLIRLAQNVAYKVNRVRGAIGQVKITSVRTTQPLRDSNGTRLQDKPIRWNDPKDEDWYERFITIMNSAFTIRTRFGKPLVQSNIEGVRTDQYVFNSIAPASGVYGFTASVNGVDLPFELHNARLDGDTGEINEISPATNNAMNVFFKMDGAGFGSANTGFFFPIKQGSLLFQDERFVDPIILRTLDINTQNINNNDFFVQQIDEDGAVLANWDKVDTVFGESVSFNTLSQDKQNLYELDTLTNDRVRVRFGDGSFGKIPVGRFRFWYRVSNQQPQVVKPVAIQNKSFVIPYVADNSLYYMTFTFSLQEQITNASSTETNFDIRTRANKVYYTQNRMITGQDYNNFFLTDNSIKKIKTINRTYSGHSRYSKLNDPTGLYQNVKHLAEDGRFYEDDTKTIDFVRADTTIVSIDELINQYIKPLLRKEDKNILYYNRYTEVYLPTVHQWKQTSVIANESRGNIVTYPAGTIVNINDDTSSVFRFVKADALLRLDNVSGRLVKVERVVEGGDAPDGIILSEEIEDGPKIYSVFPAFRNRLLADEEIQLQGFLTSRVDFAMRWDQSAEAWKFIKFNDIDKTSAFDVTNQGDTTGANMDASWLVLVEYSPGGDTNDQWKITDRGLGLFWESAREIDFIFANTTPVIDTESGLVVQDRVTILGVNESRDSLRRRGLDTFGNKKCEGTAYTYLGDGVTKCFKTSQTLLEENTVVTINGILQIPGVDYNITHSALGDSICFVIAPSLGAMIIVRVSGRFHNAAISVSRFVGDGLTDEFDLGKQVVVAPNIISFIDGIMQHSNLDFGIGQINSNASIVYNDIIPQYTSAIAYVLSGIDSTVFNKSNFLGNGTQTDYVIPGVNLNADHVLVTLDGVIQTLDQFNVISDNARSKVVIINPPATEVRVRILSVANIEFTKTKQYQFNTDGITQVYTLTGVTKTFASNVIVTLDGVMQEGPWSPNGSWAITGNNLLIFSNPPIAGLTMSVFVIVGAMGTNSGDGDDDIDVTPDNIGDITTSSCLVNYLGVDIGLNPVDVIRHDDGYVNKNGLFVKPEDLDRSGFYDRPLLFRDLVMLDGFTDLVLWRRIEEFGFDVWDPINQLTSPKGTYGLSSQGKPADESPVNTNTTKNGDIHYDIYTGKWLIANTLTGKWEAAPDQTGYRYRIGRDHLKFIWTHYAPDANRIDPSVSNIMNAYILTSRYDTAYRTWLLNNGNADDEPVPSSSEQLRIQYEDLLEYKAMSDSVIFYPARYKPLFGNKAVPELRAVFKIIQTPGSAISESDLRLRVLSAINNFFAVDNWNFGEKFYFTELCAYIHSQLAPDLQTIVIVPRNNDQAFGRLFQVRSEPDELFINRAQPDDIEVVQSLTDEELRMGAFV